MDIRNTSGNERSLRLERRNLLFLLGKLKTLNFRAVVLRASASITEFSEARSSWSLVNRYSTVAWKDLLSASRD